MKPQRMSDEAASALFLEYTPYRTFECVPEKPRGTSLAHTRINVQFLLNHSSFTFGNDALDLRRAMEGLNALACCQGFGVLENAAFWRRELPMLAERAHRVNCSNLYALDAGLVSRYRVSAIINEPTDTMAWAIVRCFSMDPSSEAMDMRTDIHKRLERFLTRKPPMLDLELKDCGPEEEDTTDQHWRLFKRCLLDASRMWQCGSTPGHRERVAIVCHAVVNGTRLRELTEILSIACVELRSFRFTVETTDEDAYEFVDALSAFMRELVRVDSVQAMTWRFPHCERLSIEAIFSAIPSMASLESFSVQFENFPDNEVLREQGVRSYYAWLTYALLAPASRVRRRQAAGVTLVKGSSELLDHTCQSLNTLVDGVASFPRARNPVLLPHGTSATLLKRAILSTAILPRVHLQRGLAFLPVLRDQHVQVISLLGSNALVVWPGFGLVWTNMSSLEAWKTRSAQVGSVGSTFPRPIVTNLMCQESDCEAVAAFLQCAGSKLVRLQLDKIDVEDDAAFRSILQSCPRLRKLQVSSLLTVAPLLHAYENLDCIISSLIIDWTPATVCDTILQSLSHHNSRIASKLQRLVLSPWPEMTRAQVEHVAAVLDHNRRLEFLRVCVASGFRGGPSLGDELLHRYVDRPVMQTPQSKSASYTFLLAARRQYVLRALPLPCAQAIAEWAAIPIRRHVSWEESG